MDQLEGFGAAKLNGNTTILHTRPEIEVPGVKITTGPLRQSIAESVVLATASKHPSEVITLAGHLKLDNLGALYDNN